MRVIMTVAVRDGEEAIDAQISYHLNVGVDRILIAVIGAGASSREVLDAYTSEDAVTLVSTPDASTAHEARALMRRAAVVERADWIIESDSDEFWWPRGPGLKDVLAPMPPRYTAVQALVRPFLPRPGDGGFFAERMTLRPSLATPHVSPQPIAQALRPIYRVRGGAVIGTCDDGSVPLHSWYPVEVLRFRLRAGEQSGGLVAEPDCPQHSMIEKSPADEGDRALWHAGGVIDDASLERRVADGSLVEDARLRDVLRELRSEPGSIRQFALPSERSAPFALPGTSIVDDAAYAVECAAVGEVDLAGIDRHIRDLEGRISFLEQRFWARVVRKLSRVGRGDRS